MKAHIACHANAQQEAVNPPAFSRIYLEHQNIEMLKLGELQRHEASGLRKCGPERQDPKPAIK